MQVYPCITCLLLFTHWIVADGPLKLLGVTFIYLDLRFWGSKWC